MKKILILVLAIAPIFLKAQSTKVENMGNHYQISLAGATPIGIMGSDSVSLRVTVTCMATLASEVNFVPIGAKLKYKMQGAHLISSAIRYWRKGVYMGQKCLPTVCGSYISGGSCFQKI